jgi:hypothetical protein
MHSSKSLDEIAAAAVAEVEASEDGDTTPELPPRPPASRHLAPVISFSYGSLGDAGPAVETHPAEDPATTAARQPSSSGAGGEEDRVTFPALRAPAEQVEGGLGSDQQASSQEGPPGFSFWMRGSDPGTAAQAQVQQSGELSERSSGHVSQASAASAPHLDSVSTEVLALEAAAPMSEAPSALVRPASPRPRQSSLPQELLGSPGPSPHGAPAERPRTPRASQPAQPHAPPGPRPALSLLSPHPATDALSAAHALLSQQPAARQEPAGLPAFTLLAPVSPERYDAGQRSARTSEPGIRIHSPSVGQAEKVRGSPA